MAMRHFMYKRVAWILFNVNEQRVELIQVYERAVSIYAYSLSVNVCMRVRYLQPFYLDNNLFHL